MYYCSFVIDAQHKRFKSDCEKHKNQYSGTYNILQMFMTRGKIFKFFYEDFVILIDCDTNVRAMSESNIPPRDFNNDSKLIKYLVNI